MKPNSHGVGAMVREFHEAFGLPVREEPTWPIEWREVRLRVGLIREEAEEAEVALFADGQPCLEKALPEIAKELADLVYVVYGAALHYGIDLHAAIAETHRSNMSKLGEDGKPITRVDGKVLKGPGYCPPRPDVLVGRVHAGQERLV